MREDYDDSLEGPIFDEQTGAPLNVRPLWPPLPAPGWGGTVTAEGCLTRGWVLGVG